MGSAAGRRQRVVELTGVGSDPKVVNPTETTSGGGALTEVDGGALVVMLSQVVPGEAPATGAAPALCFGVVACAAAVSAGDAYVNGTGGGTAP